MKQKSKSLIRHKEIILISLPIILQFLISTSLNFFDSLMVGRLGDDAVAALGIANQYFFLINMFFVGIVSGCGVLIAQYFGKGEIKQLRLETGIALSITVVASVFFGLGAFYGTDILVKIFNASESVGGKTQDYLRVAAFSYFFQAISMTFGFASRNVKNPYLPAIAGAFAFFLNIVLNYGLIYGNLGLPEMGVAGAALATLIARFAEMTVLLFVLYLRKSPLIGPFKEYFSFTISDFGKTTKTVTPVLLNEFGFGLGWLAYSIFFARTMLNAIVAVQIAVAVQNVFITIVFGFAGAASVIIGNEIGKGNKDEAVLYSSTILKLSLYSSFVMMIILLFSINPILSMYDISETLSFNTKIMLISDAVVLPLRFVSLVLILGVFRGGGDFKYSLIIEMLPMWLIGVFLAVLGAEVFGLTLWAVYILVKVEEFTKIGFGLSRYRNKKWIHDLTD